MLEKLKKLFKIVNFSGSVTLKDGTEILLDGGNLDKGVKCFVSLPNAEEPIVLPDGEYTLETDEILVIKDGMISDILPPQPDEEPEAETSGTTSTSGSTEMSEENIEEIVNEMAKDTTGTTETPAPTETPEEVVAKKMKELDDRLTAIEDSLKQVSGLTQSTQKLESDLTSLTEKLQTTDGAVKLASQKVPVVLTPAETRHQNIKRALKN